MAAEKRIRGTCKCPNCGFEQPHEVGTLCSDVVCPECGSFLDRSE